ncbi:MAG TPA: hypothetical protein VG329_01620 [Candidatus Dormibacteraeota bacterium]|jgi:hypothetical protein|nr:hypothetical protein [Candidatus Dormibacteraeota bacterium]
MSQTWDDFSSTTSDDDATDTTDASGDVADASADISSAANAAEWGQWNEATGDDAVDSANSYLDAAQVASAEGFDDAAAQDLTDAGAQMDVASDSYSDAADNYDTAASDLSDASADLSSASADVSDAGSYDAGVAEE